MGNWEEGGIRTAFGELGTELNLESFHAEGRMAEQLQALCGRREVLSIAANKKRGRYISLTMFCFTHGLNEPQGWLQA